MTRLAVLQCIGTGLYVVAMISDPITVAGLVTREVRTGTRDAQPTKIVVARRIYRSDQADLWDALTNPERLPRWFLPIEGDLVVGGRYQLVGNAGGLVERCDEPRSFAVTWEMGPMISWLAVALRAVEGGTQLELVHEAPVDPALWEQFGPGAVGIGWDLALMGLGLHLDSGQPRDPEAGMAFPTTPAGATFVRTSAEDWARAATAAGDPPHAAAEAASRSVAFYTGAPAPGE